MQNTTQNVKRLKCWYCNLEFDANDEQYRTEEKVCIIPPSTNWEFEVRMSKITKYVPCPRCGMSCDNQEISQRLF